VSFGVSFRNTFNLLIFLHIFTGSMQEISPGPLTFGLNGGGTNFYSNFSQSIPEKN